MASFNHLLQEFGSMDCSCLTLQHLEELRNGLKQVECSEITSEEDARQFLALLRKFREGVSAADKLHGDNYPELLNSLLSVGEDGLYSNNLRFIFELIQNVDDCEFPDTEDHELKIHFDFNNNQIVLRYNESGFTPFNVFAITGIAEAAKNISSGKNQIGEKGIGFKSVFGVTNKVLIRSGWFSFELHKENFTIPVANYQNHAYCSGTEMTLFVPGGKAELIYNEIKKQYCSQEALFSRNPLLFLNKLTTLKMYYDGFRSMEFHVDRPKELITGSFYKEEDVRISVNLRDYENGNETNVTEEILCTRYSHSVIFHEAACKSRYGPNTKVGSEGGKPMVLQAIFPHPDELDKVKNGALYSFLPTQLRFTVPLVCHVPFKLDASREFVDPQENNLWFRTACKFLSELLDYAYLDWAKAVRNDIVSYLPENAQSVFARNNGKEKCLSTQSDFRGEHFSGLPIFYSVNGEFLDRSKVFCFDPTEEIEDPIQAYRLMVISRELFLLPTTHRYDFVGIKIERNIYRRLFSDALQDASHTYDILRYLDTTKFKPEEEYLPAGELRLTVKQIELFMHYQRFAEFFKNLGIKKVRTQKRPSYTIHAGQVIPFEEVFRDFQLSDAPKAVENYLNRCQHACILAEIEPPQFFVGYDALVLSSSAPEESFSAFCYAVDNNDTFSVRMKMGEISKRLNQLSESDEGTAEEYLRELRQNRLLVQQAIGHRQYRNYIDLILKAGTSSARFIQELLQNADDCEYADGVIPEFVLKQYPGKIVTQYNECGFTRANIRAITAIGESTKNYLIKQNVDKIGEKGVGFKTIFAVASAVHIHSGEYHFSLTDHSPTIPEPFEGEKENISGTKMELDLKGGIEVSHYKPNEILELCLCLRKIRKIRINDNISVKIDDTKDSRIITINKHQYKFRRFIHRFSVDDAALRSRENSLRNISASQQIVCYLPESSSKEFPLYSGLPTKHRIKVPLAIDAPFMLTTSREEIETGSAPWNNRVRTEMYMAIKSVLDEIKFTERHKTLRLLRFLPRLQGSRRVYVNEMFDCEYLNQYDFLSEIRAAPILPTFDSNVFVSADQTAYRYPELANFLFRKGYFDSISPSTILDIPHEESLDTIMNALACPEARFSQYYSLLRNHAANFIDNSLFRDSCYECLENSPTEYQLALRELPIIPVHSKSGDQTEYISWQEDAIFVKKDCKKSGQNYYILNEAFLPKSTCEKIFDVNINEMNFNWERSGYNDHLRETIRGADKEEIYHYILSEFSRGAFQKYQSREILMGMKDFIPLKNQLGEIPDTNLFVCEEVTGFFQSPMILSVAIHDECKALAVYLDYPSLSTVYYQDICNAVSGVLTIDDLEDLTTDYFVNSDDILRNFFWAGRLPDELVTEYGLEYLTMQLSQEEESYAFPEDPVRNIDSIRRHIQKLLQNPTIIIHEKVERTIQCGYDAKGNKFNLDTKDVRNMTLSKYTPLDVHDRCFCQLCGKVKPYSFMEVNAITENPRYFFPQARVALCLECSKRFEAIRRDNSRRYADDPFVSAIKQAKIGTEGFVDVPLRQGESIRFTATHLAELQEILRAKMI